MSTSTNTKIDPTHIDDLRKVYLYVFDAFAVSPGEIVQAFKGINSRYARELLATLQAHDFVIMVEDGEGSEAWQSVNTKDEFTEQQVADEFDTWAKANGWKPPKADKKSSKSRPATRTKDEGTHPCYCGCGENVPSKSFYRPGHDARHAGVLGKRAAEEIVATGGVKVDLDVDKDRFSDLPSDRLVAKAVAIADKRIEKALSKTHTKIIEGKAMRGKTEVEARKVGDEYEYIDDRGDWRPLSKAASKTFQPVE